MKLDNRSVNSSERSELRFDEIERQLASVTRRMDSLERIVTGRTAVAPARETPPPTPPALRPEQETPKPAMPKTETVSEPAEASAPSTWNVPPPVIAAPRAFQATQATPPKPKEDVEYNIGAKVLPWAGALTLILALGFFIAIGIERGWLTPAVQFGLALLSSAVFMFFGYRHREEREDFGQLLMGLGSCGVYLSFAGAHVFHKLFVGEVLVAAFFVWSLVNLGYSLIIGSRAFHAIGFIGGLLASIMPLQNENSTAAALLHFSIVIPSMLAAVRVKWNSFVTFGWFITSFSLSLAYYQSDRAPIWIGLIGLNTIIACLANLFTFEKTEFDPRGVFPAIALTLTGVFIVFAKATVAYGIVELVLAGVALAIAWIFRDKKGADMLAIGGGILAFCFAPSSLTSIQPVFVYAGLAAALAAVSHWHFRRLALKFASVELLLAFGAMLLQGRYADSWQIQAWALGSLALATMVVGWFTALESENAEPTIFATLGLLFIILSRWVMLPYGELNLALPALLVAWPCFAILAVVALGKRSAVAVVVSVMIWVLASVLYLGLGDVAVPATLRYAILVSTLVAAPVLAFVTLQRASEKNHAESREIILNLYGLAAAGTVTQLLTLVFTNRLNLSPSVSIVYSLATVSLIGSATLAFTKFQVGAILGWLFGAASVFMFSVTTGVTWSPASVGLQIVLIAAASYVTGSWLRKSKGADGALSVYAGIAITWFLLESLAKAWSVSLSPEWVTVGLRAGFAVILLAIGFRSDDRTLRLGGIAVFGVTTVGVLFRVIWEAQDPIIRVLMLTGLGLAMLGGGYAYIRSQKGKAEPVIEPNL